MEVVGTVLHSPHPALGEGSSFENGYWHSSTTTAVSCFVACLVLLRRLGNTRRGSALALTIPTMFIERYFQVSCPQSVGAVATRLISATAAEGSDSLVSFRVRPKKGPLWCGNPGGAKKVPRPA